MPVCATGFFFGTRAMTDEERERAIDAFRQYMEQAESLIEREYWWMQMAYQISHRSPEQVKRMEASLS